MRKINGYIFMYESGYNDANLKRTMLIVQFLHKQQNSIIPLCAAKTQNFLSLMKTPYEIPDNTAGIDSNTSVFFFTGAGP
jgi:hypothetical protein